MQFKLIYLISSCFPILGSLKFEDAPEFPMKGGRKHYTAELFTTWGSSTTEMQNDDF